MVGKGLHKWVCPTDRELCLRSRLNNGMGWSYNSYAAQTGISLSKREGIAKEELEHIENVVKQHNELVKLEEERIGRLMEKFNNMKRTQGDGVSACLICNTYFGFMKAKPFRCNLCQKSVCSKCKVETETRQIVVPRVLCRVCSEYREIWKKSNAWFYHDIPSYTIPPKLPKPQPYTTQKGANMSPIASSRKPPIRSIANDSWADFSSSDSSSVSSVGSDEESEADSEGTVEEEQSLEEVLAEEAPEEVEEEAVLDTGELGALEFSLQYDPIEEMLNVMIIQAQGLKSMDVGGTSDPYVKCNIIPGVAKATKLKTGVKECELDPVFNEKLTYHGISEHDINTKMLRLTVLDYDRMTTNDMIGVTKVSLSGLVPQQEHFYRHILAPPEENEDKETAVYTEPGRIQLSLHYQQEKELHVTVVRCSMLMVPGSITLPNPIVKLHLKPKKNGNAKGNKRKTEILKKTSNPHYELSGKAKFTYNIDNMDLECLEVTVWDCSSGLKRSNYIGGVVLGKDASSEHARTHWNDALSSGGHRVTRWHMLSSEDKSLGDSSSIDNADLHSQSSVASSG